MRRFSRFGLILAIFGLPFIVFAPSSHSLIMSHEGNEPMEIDPGFPDGSMVLANLENRIGYCEGPPFGGGEYNFAYQCKNTEEFNQALLLFSKIKVPNTISYFAAFCSEVRMRKTEKPLLLVVYDAPKPNTSVNFYGKRIDWSFTIWKPEAFHQLFNGESAFEADHPSFRQTVPPPRIEVNVSENGPIVWDDIDVPKNVRIVDMRSSVKKNQNGTTISGRAFDMTNHQLIPNATVSIVKRDQGQNKRYKTVHCITCDETGRYTIDTSEDGYCYLLVEAEGYVPRRAFGFSAFGQDLEWDVLLLKGACIEGFVTDLQGHPLKGIDVYASNTIGIDGLGYECGREITAKTDAEGRFVITGVPCGSARFNASVSGMHQKGSVLKQYPIKSFQYENRENIVLILERTGIVKGRISDDNGNPPERPAIVEIKPIEGQTLGSWGGSMNVKPDGSYEFKDVPPGSYLLKVTPNPRKNNDAFKPIELTVKEGSVLEINIETPPVKTK